ncbi:DUF3419 family protein [Kitasatospora sp. NPDC058965]|uniref:DUF3419 family protein n=1 Tax=Kitasatospora sp. NPDC058965 TaxID=3346682 RepID=UPI0036C76FD8
MSANPWSGGRLTALQAGGPRVLFGRMYEDPGIELAAFPPPGARVLCVASAGDTAAALAAAGYRVTAVDLNPAQLAYARARLTEPAAGGDGRPAHPVDGSAERLLGLGRRTAGALLPAWRPAAVERFLRLADPVEQARQWHRSLDGPGLRRLLRLTLRPAGSLALALRPQFRGVLPPGFDTVLRRRIARAVGRHPNAANPWAWRLFAGRELPDAGTPDRVPPMPPVPPVLPKPPMPPVPAAPPVSPVPPVPPVRLVLGDVAEVLERSAPGAFDAVTLSNVLDGPDPQFARRLRAAVRHAVRPGGVVVLRSVREPGPAGPGLAAEDRSMLWGVVRVARVGPSEEDFS